MERNSKWYQLDNAAKIIPSTAKGGNTRVFRITCELKEEVVPQILQEALDQTIMDFPHFNCVLRTGLFWYYLVARNMRALVTEDNLPKVETRPEVVELLKILKNKFNICGYSWEKEPDIEIESVKNHKNKTKLFEKQ